MEPCENETTYTFNKKSIYFKVCSENYMFTSDKILDLLLNYHSFLKIKTL